MSIPGTPYRSAHANCVVCGVGRRISHLLPPRRAGLAADTGDGPRMGRLWPGRSGACHGTGPNCTTEHLATPVAPVISRSDFSLEQAVHVAVEQLDGVTDRRVGGRSVKAWHSPGGRDCAPMSRSNQEASGFPGVKRCVPSMQGIRGVPAIEFFVALGTAPASGLAGRCRGAQPPGPPPTPSPGCSAGATSRAQSSPHAPVSSPAMISRACTGPRPLPSCCTPASSPAGASAPLPAPRRPARPGQALSQRRWIATGRASAARRGRASPPRRGWQCRLAA